MADLPSTSTSGAAWIGRRLGPYEVVRHLARGGFGDVFEARDDDGAWTAVKVLVDASPASAQRFAREARIAAGLAHPHIVRVLGWGATDEGVPWLATELLRGRDLRALLRARALDAAAVLGVAMQACDALAHAHDRSVVHRDIKPGNLFVCDGAAATSVRVLDFGLARARGDARITATGAVVGTVAYASPEQCRDERDLDARTDLWSLGVTLYEGLAGELPFRASTDAGRLYQILFEDAPDLAARRPDLPPAVVSIVRQCLRRQRDERFASATSLRAALAAALPLVGGVGPAPPRDDTDDVDPRALAETADAVMEQRLATVVALLGARDLAAVDAHAQRYGGHVAGLGPREVLVSFGAARWTGEEPSAAVRFADACAAAVSGAGVATGRAVRQGAVLTGAVVDAAVALARRGGVSLDASTARFADRTARDPDDRGGSVRASPFVGREAERALIADAVEQARAGVSGVVVLGAPGAGRSRLCAEALDALRSDAPDVSARATRCEAWQRDVALSSLRSALGDAAAPSEPGGDPMARLDRVRATLERALRTLAGEGVAVLALDDAQWLDAGSRDALRWVCERAPDLRVAVWLFARSEARETLADVVPGATVRELGPLPRASAEALLRAVAGACPEALLARAGGNPLFLEELGALHVAGHDAGALPVTVEAALLAQIDRLDVDERELLKRAAVLGHAAWPDALDALGATGSALHGLRRAQVLVPSRGSRFAGHPELTFRSALLREVAYELWTSPQRARLHGLAAQWLAQRPECSPGELALHWDRAGDAPRAAESYARATEDSARLGDAATACAHAARVLALTDDVGLRWRALVGQDSALQIAGDRGAQRAGLDALDALATSLGPAARADVAWRRCYAARLTGRVDEALRSGDEALARAAEAGDLRVEALAHDELALLLADEGRGPEASAHSVAARALAERAGDPWLAARTLATRAYQVLHRGDAAEALALCARAADEFAAADDPRREALLRANAGFARLRLGRFDEAAADLDAAAASSARVGNARTVAMCAQNRATVRRARGDLAGARADLDRAGAEAVRLGHVRLEAAVAIERLYIALAEDRCADALARGEVDAARDAAERARTPSLRVSAWAAGLRVRQGAGHAVADELAAGVASRAAVDVHDESRVELELALSLATDPAATETLRAAIEDVLAAIADPAAREGARRSLAVRFVAPPGTVT